MPGLPAVLNQPGTERFTSAIAYRIDILNLRALHVQQLPDAGTLEGEEATVCVPS